MVKIKAEACCSEEFKELTDWLKGELEKRGIDPAQCCTDDQCCEPQVKVVCVAPGLSQSVCDLGKATRDQVVMVRVDAESSQALSAWVEAGAVKSRSEAAALFIREGLKVRRDELEKLRDALSEVERAKTKLRDKAREVFGQGDGES